MRIVFPEGSGCVQGPEDLAPVKKLGTVDYYEKPPENKADLIQRLRDADIVFLDPPYEMEKEYAAVLDALAGAPPALVIVQHSVRCALADAYGALVRTRIVKQGDNALSFYSVPAALPHVE